MPAKPILYLIDGSSQMYRAFHAPIRTLEGTLLRNALGQPTNAVYIFVTMLRKLLKEHAPEYIAASFDLPGRTFRDDLAADYNGVAGQFNVSLGTVTQTVDRVTVVSSNLFCNAGAISVAQTGSLIADVYPSRILVANAGAYGRAMSSSYNLRDPAVEICI